MTSDIKLLERLIRHQILVQSFAGSQIKQARPILRQLARDLRERIAAADATDFQMGRMVALERDIRALVASASDGIQQALDLEDFVVEEAQFAQRLLGASVSVDLAEGIDLDAVRAITTRRQMQLVSGKTVKNLTIPQMWQEFTDGATREVTKQVQDSVRAGILEGKTQQQMAREVAALVQTRTRRQAETVIRTATNGIGGAARDHVYRDNSDILEGERFLATLDSRTTITCAGFDQTIHPLGQGPRPPLHYGCRSLRVPVVKEQYRIAALGERASMDGPVSNQLTFGGFLRNQSDEFVDDYLGSQRAKLFRSGALKIEQFTDDLGRPLSLDELQQRYDLTMA